MIDITPEILKEIGNHLNINLADFCTCEEVDHVIIEQIHQINLHDTPVSKVDRLAIVNLEYLTLNIKLPKERNSYYEVILSNFPKAEEKIFIKALLIKADKLLAIINGYNLVIDPTITKEQAYAKDIIDANFKRLQDNR